jgi:hypothetical protein
MMQKLALCFFWLLLLASSACGGQPPRQAPATLTPDPNPCSPQNLPATVQEIHDLTRGFDSAAAQISGLTDQQLPDTISELQRIRRTAEDLSIPPCLTTLKTHQQNYMNLVIQTLLVSVGGGDQQTLDTGLEAARAEYQRYSLELVRLLGITLSPVTATP